MDANVVTDLEKIAQSEDLANKLIVWSSTARLTDIQDDLLGCFINMLRHELNLPSGRKLTGAQACYEVEAL